VKLFDSCIIANEPLQIIYYHVLDVANLSEGLGHLEPGFKATLGSLFPEASQRAVRAIWYMDKQGQVSLELQKAWGYRLEASSKRII